MIDLETMKHVAGVYFLRSREFVKIGYSVVIGGRMGVLCQAVRPFEATLVAVITEPSDLLYADETAFRCSDFLWTLEQHLHAHFAAYRAWSEWFRLTDAQVEEGVMVGHEFAKKYSIEVSRKRRAAWLAKVERVSKRNRKALGWDPCELGA